ncbi:unnamed protein product [Allacma fusca]|uniref:Uncharacterized protein n=1 Tax=Allacma fusca TaxID=39272 RepID=A0A8J2NSS7_9HEXA|nr:unnamed protein product [Allacma fusca]
MFTASSATVVLIAVYIASIARSVNTGFLTKDTFANFSGPCDLNEYNAEMLPIIVLKAYVQKICFAAALQCKRKTHPNGNTKDTCECLAIPKRKFVFSKTKHDGCKAALHTSCTSKGTGFECAEGLVCQDDVCTKDSAVLSYECSWSPASWQFYLIALTVLKTP